MRFSAFGGCTLRLNSLHTQIAQDLCSFSMRKMQAVKQEALNIIAQCEAAFPANFAGVCRKRRVLAVVRTGWFRPAGLIFFWRLAGGAEFICYGQIENPYR
jgi:hypothetical protein